MTDINTYIIYLTTLLFMVGSTYYLGGKKLKSEGIYEPNKLNILYLLILIIFSIFIGFRYDVGVDWQGYVTDYIWLTSSSEFNYFDQYYEIGYYTINWFAGLLNLGHQGVFLFMAFISWYFYFKSVPKNIIPLFIFFIFVDEYFFWGMNGVRQFAAMAIWVYSIKYIIDKNLKYFLLTVIFASVFHLSSIFLIVFYIFPFERMYNLYIWVIAYVLSLIVVFFIDLSVIYNNLDFFVLALSDDIGTVERYARYAESGRLTAQETSLGLGFIFKIVINIMIIILSKSWIKRQPKYKPYLVLFFIGAILFNIFYEFQLINRLSHYFLIFRPLLLAFIVRYYWVYMKDRLLGPSLMILYFIIFVAAMYGNSNMCCPYQFQF